MYQRVQLEYDELLVRCSQCLWSAGKSGVQGAWQFLAVLPFHAVDDHHLWRIYALLHEVETDVTTTQIIETLDASYTKTNFDEKLCALAADDAYYLLSTFANMAGARNELRFVRFAMLELLRVGFVSDVTRESLEKTSGPLLCGIVAKKPELLSDLIGALVEVDEDVFSGCLSLLRDLPLHSWIPSENDWKLLEEWLVAKPPTSASSRLARIILSSLNWGANATGVLVLPEHFHDRAALLLAESLDKHCKEQLSFPHQPETPERSLIRWAWRLAYALKLHATDRGRLDVSKVPEIVALDVIRRGCRELKPLPLFLSLMMTTHGHLVPMVCSHGFAALAALVDSGAHEPAIVALHSLLPLFVDCTDSLASCDGFRNVITALLNLDQSRLKSIVGAGEAGAVSQLLAHMLEHQLSYVRWQSLAVAWTRVLLAVPNWAADPGAQNLLDTILRTSVACGNFQLRSAIVKEFASHVDRVRSERSSTSGWTLWMGSGSFTGLLDGTRSQWAWLADACLEAEHELLERRTGLWSELLRQLRISEGKTNVDACLKRACNAKNTSSGGSKTLCLYRWALQAADAPLDHPLTPALWYRFFELYLERIPEGGCVGAKFFDGVVNSTTAKRLKRRLQEAVSHCKGDENRSRLYSSYLLWLEEPLIQEASLYLPSIPVQYDPARLAAIIERNRVSAT